MRRLIVLVGVFGVLGTALALGACGGGNDEPAEPTPTQEATGIRTASATSTRSAGAVVGQVDDADGDALVNGERANQNLKLRSADRIETKASSSIDFTLDAPRVECKTLANSMLEVRPDASTLIKWLSRKGVSYCSVESGDPAVKEHFGLDPDVRITLEGTIFGISQSTLRVVEGFVTYTFGRSTERLGPNEEVTFSATGQPGQKQAWDGLDPDESTLVGALQNRRTPISVTPTEAERQFSNFIRTNEDRPVMLLLLDQSARPQDQDFIVEYLARLGETWFGVGDVQVQRTTRTAAMSVLAEKPFAVYVGPPTLVGRTATATPTPAKPSPTPSKTATLGAVTGTSARPNDVVPIYVDGGGNVWSIEIAADLAARSALARFTKGILANGDYYDLYAPIFGEAPPYNRLLELLK